MSFIPRKDQCNVCLAAKMGNNAVHMKHMQDKSMAQQMKVEDKSKSDDATSVWTMDLQSVLLRPRTQTCTRTLKIWSDGCGYPKKCSAVTNAFMQLSVELDINAEQKFLVTPNWSATVCTAQLKGSSIVTSSHQGIMLIDGKRQTPAPYHVREVVYSDAKKTWQVCW
ncbi:hypothetical protein RRG08_052734 [Elysia crispata]|uniref:Uncharacterized protein n=1 Tax=Elysia crispata TaxID=231223 RepID=A0AAE1B654_9GAST|nr:hypothetical protein RRG08_052734 [Elysia crispata]